MSENETNVAARHAVFITGPTILSVQVFGLFRFTTSTFVSKNGYLVYLGSQHPTFASENETNLWLEHAVFKPDNGDIVHVVITRK